MTVSHADFNVTYFCLKYVLETNLSAIWIHPFFPLTKFPNPLDEKHVPQHGANTTMFHCALSRWYSDTVLMITSCLSYRYRSNINYALTHWVTGCPLLDGLNDIHEELSVVGAEFQVLAILPTQSHHMFIQQKTKAETNNQCNYFKLVKINRCILIASIIYTFFGYAILILCLHLKVSMSKLIL